VADTTSYAIESLDLLRKARGAANEWLENVDRWEKYARLSQWTAGDATKMKTLGIPNLTHDFILPSVEQGVSFLTHNTPRFNATGTDFGDVDLGNNVADLLSYIWYTSDGDIEYKKHVYDYYVKSKGVWEVSEDTEADDGRGELRISSIDPRNVYFDPSSKDLYGKDAAWILVHERVDRRVATNMYPEFAEKIKLAQNTHENQPVESTVQSAYGHTTTADIDFFEQDDLDHVRRYEKFKRNYHRLLFVDDGFEPAPLTDKEYRKAKKANYAQVTRQDGSASVVDEMTGRQMAAMGEDVQFFTLEELISRGSVEHVQFKKTRIRRFVSIGEVELGKDELEISEYPVVPCPNKHSGNPFPISDVAGAISPQDFYNKMVSLVVQHTQDTVSYKALFPKGMGVDIQKLEENFSKPGTAFGEYNAEALSANGQAGVIVLQTPPLSGAALALLQDAKHKIEYQFGIFENMMGSGQMAPETFRGTMAIDEMGQRRMRSKIKDIENALAFFGKVVVEWAQSFYSLKKIIRITEPDGEIRETMFNSPEEYQAAAQAQIMNNDLSRNRYDIRVVAGSSLPTNKWAELETIKDAIGLGVQQLVPEFLKRLDIPGATKIAAGYQQDMAYAAQLQQAQRAIKDLQGQLQTTRRESLQDEKKVEFMKFKTKLDQFLNEVKTNNAAYSNEVRSEVEKTLEAFRADLDKEMEPEMNEQSV
jgi:hypothetical protein